MLFDEEFYFVCKFYEYDKLCKVLGHHIRQYEMDQYEMEQYDDLDSNGLSPAELFFHGITSANSIFKRDIYTPREYHGSITITISREAKDHSWVFNVKDLDGES